MNESSVRVRDRTEAVAQILRDQRAFAVSGWDDAKRDYWARTGEPKGHLHRWTIVE
jgi:hypothetical protein